MKASPYSKSNGKCWACKSKTSEILKIENLPLTGRFPKKDEDYLTGDIGFSVCGNCKLIMIDQAYSPDDLYSEYYYRTAINNTMRKHISNLIIHCINKYGKEKQGNWLDIGCNDGYTVSIAKAIGWEVTGVDPSNVIGSYFNNLYSNEKTKARFINDIYPPQSDEIRDKFQIISTISMFYDIHQIENFVNSIDNHLADDGIWVIEMNYTKDMLLKNGYDMISHEHITYYTLSSFIKILGIINKDFKVFDVLYTPINGGSISIFVDKGKRPTSKNVDELCKEEEKVGLNSVDKIKSYFKDIQEHSKEVNNFFNKLKQQKKKISIYGASTRGNTNILLSELDHNVISYAYEKNPDKFGRYCPGTDILIKNEKSLLKDMPDYLIVMPYSFINEFLIKESKYLEMGGKMVTLVPEIKIYESNI